MRKVRDYYEILKPCPKCGSKHLTVIHWKTAWFTTKFQVECYDCGYKISSKNKGTTLKKWGINNNKYEDKNGNKKYTTEVVAESIEFVGNKKQDDPVPEETQFPDNYKSEYQNNIILNDDMLPF